MKGTSATTVWNGQNAKLVHGDNGTIEVFAVREDHDGRHHLHIGSVPDPAFDTAMDEWDHRKDFDY